jgi:hypothetical protein
MAVSDSIAVADFLSRRMIFARVFPNQDGISPNGSVRA